METWDENEILDGLRAVMGRFLSPASVNVTLARSVTELKLDGARLTPAETPRLVEHAMLGLRIFCAPERLADLMLDLADFCERVES